MTQIFKEYDIRGTYPYEINEKIFYKIGSRLKSLGYKKIAVGRDGRLSSEALFKSLSSGILDSGVDLIDLGVVSSPMLSFFCAFKEIKGAMITASHNPKNYNGIKFIDEKGVQLRYEVFLNKIESTLNLKMKGSDKGKMSSFDVLPLYRQHFLNFFNKKWKKGIKVVFDCSNGVGGIPLLSIIPNINVECVIINDKIDGNFPAHECDQTKEENLKQLKDEVVKNKADLGVIFDGDADRCAFVDEKGMIAPLDISFLLLALNELNIKKLKNPKFIFDLRFSKSVYEILKEKGATPQIMRVGNPFYKLEMHKDENILIAGELSGHIMYKDNFAIDDAMFASLKMIEILSNSDKKVSELIIQNKKYYQTGEISTKVYYLNECLEEIKKKYSKYQESLLDGISVVLNEVWFNVRASNTEPLIRFELEGVNKKEVEKQKSELIKIINSFKVKK